MSRHQMNPPYVHPCYQPCVVERGEGDPYVIPVQDLGAFAMTARQTNKSAGIGFKERKAIRREFAAMLKEKEDMLLMVQKSHLLGDGIVSNDIKESTKQSSEAVAINNLKSLVSGFFVHYNLSATTFTYQLTTLIVGKCF